MFATSVCFNGRVYQLANRKAMGKSSKDLSVFGSLLVAFLIVFLSATVLSLVETSVIRAQEITRFQQSDVQVLHFVQPEAKLWPADNKLFLGNLA